MRTVVATEHITIDSVMPDPGTVGEIAHGWSNTYFNDKLATYQHDRLFATDALTQHDARSWTLHSPSLCGRENNDDRERA